jgi:hypothetical protein
MKRAPHWDTESAGLSAPFETGGTDAGSGRAALGAVVPSMPM